MGKRPLAARFAREGTHHISSIVVALRSIMKRAGEASGDSADAPMKYARNDGGDRFLPPNSSVTPPEAKWTVKRLIERVGTAIQIDAAAKPRTPPRLTVPALVAGRSVPNESGRTVTTAATIGSAFVSPLAPAQIKALSAQTSAAVPASSAVTATKTSSTTPTPAPVPTLEAMQLLGPIADYEPPVTSGVIVNALESSDIATLLCGIAIELRRLLAPNSTAPEFSRSAAQTVYGVLGTQSQLYGWQHVSGDTALCADDCTHIHHGCMCLCLCVCR